MSSPFQGCRGHEKLGWTDWPLPGGHHQPGLDHARQAAREAHIGYIQQYGLLAALYIILFICHPESWRRIWCPFVTSMNVSSMYVWSVMCAPLDTVSTSCVVHFTIGPSYFLHGLTVCPWVLIDFVTFAPNLLLLSPWGKESFGKFWQFVQRFEPQTIFLAWEAWLSDGHTSSPANQPNPPYWCHNSMEALGSMDQCCACSPASLT